jgi:hypothetical protein
MKLGIHSKNRVFKTFENWSVPKDFADPMYNYLIYGYEPGSFFTAVLANDFVRAVQCSHPGNTIQALKYLAGWIVGEMPGEARGDYETVDQWCRLSADMRRNILENKQIIYTKEEEMMLILSGEHVAEIVLY